MERLASEKRKHAVRKGPVSRNDRVRSMRKVELCNEDIAIPAEGLKTSRERRHGAHKMGRTSDLVAGSGGGNATVVGALVIGWIGQQKGVL